MGGMDEAKTLEHSHEPEAIRQRIGTNPSYSYLKDFVYGAIDGTVTTFAVVSSVAGAGLDLEKENDIVYRGAQKRSVRD